MFIGAKDSILLIYSDFVIRFTAALHVMFQSTEYENRVFALENFKLGLRTGRI